MKMPVKTIFVCVSQAMDGKMPDDIDPKKTPLIDMARGCWMFDLSKAKECDWLVAVCHSQTVGVYEIDKKFGWRVSKPGCIPTRNVSASEKTKYYCQLKDISKEGGATYMHKYVRMYGAVQYS